MRRIRSLLAAALLAGGMTAVAAAPAEAAPAAFKSFTQCVNGTGKQKTCEGGWVNGTINATNSAYTEDQVVPQRVLLTLPADAANHTLTFTYQDRKGSVHAYDSLATWNKSMSAADPCQGITATLCQQARSTLPMSADPARVAPTNPTTISNLVSDHDLDDADRQWTMYGATLVSDQVISHSVANPVTASTTDDLVKVSVTFKNPDPSKARDVVLLFGGHLAVGGPATLPRAWGTDLGASTIGGSSYAIKLETLDGVICGAKTNQVQGGVTKPVAPAVFGVTKTASSATAEARGAIGYTVVVTNTGGTAGSTSFVDDYDDRIGVPVVAAATGTAGVTAATCTLGTSTTPSAGNKVLRCTTGTIPAGGSQTFTYATTMPAAFDSGAGSDGCASGAYPVRNTVTLATNATATARVCVAGKAVLVVDKAASTFTTTPGRPVTYTVTVSNTGTAAGSGSVLDDFDDRLTPGAVTILPSGGACTVEDIGTTSAPNRALRCSTGTIAAGSSQTFQYTVTMPATFTGTPGGSGCGAAYPVKNTAAVGTSSKTVTVCVGATPDFRVAKTVVGSRHVLAGDEVTYRVVVSNTGSAPGTTSAVDDYDDAVTITRAPQACSDSGRVLTCTTDSIAAGGSQTFEYTARMPAKFTGTPGGADCAPNEFQVVNRVTIGSTTTQDSAIVCVKAEAAFTVTKSATPSTVAAGGRVTYVVTVTNTGRAPGSTRFDDDHDDRLSPSDAVPSPAGALCAPSVTSGDGHLVCDTAVLAPGAKQTFTYTALMPATFRDSDRDTAACSTGYPVRNTVTVPGSRDAATVCVTAAPAFTLTKSAATAVAAPGATVRYTLTVTNSGSAQGSTTVTDTTPATIAVAPSGCTVATTAGQGSVLTCRVADVLAAGSRTIEYDATMPASFDGDPSSTDCSPAAYPVKNRAELTGGAFAERTVCVTATPSFTFTKDVTAEKATPGQTLTYTVRVTNTGTAPGSTSFVDDYADGVSVASAPSGCSDGAGRLSCTTERLKVGASQDFTYRATLPTTYSGADDVDPCGPGEYPVTNRVLRSGDLVAERTVCVAAAPDLKVTKSVTVGPYRPGQQVTYTLTVTNAGAVAGTTTAVDTLDSRVADSVIAPAGCDRTGTTLTCLVGAVAPGGTTRISYQATLPGSFTGLPGQRGCATDTFPVVNGVRLTGGATDSVTLCVPATPTLTLSKTSTVDTLSDGRQLITYTLSYANTGAAQARDVVLRDQLPTGTTFDRCSDGCVVAGTPSVATWAIPDVAAGASGSVTLRVLVSSNQVCTVSNTAAIRTGTRPEVVSNTVQDGVTPRPDATTAVANGSAVGVQVTANNLLGVLTSLLSGGQSTLTLGSARTSQVGPGGPATDSSTALSASALGLGIDVIDAGVIRTTSASTITPAPAEARQTTTSETARVCLVKIGTLCTVESGTVRAVASTVAAGDHASVSSAGSTIENLKVLGLATPVDLNQTTRIDLPAAVFGAGSYVAINERTATSGLTNGRWQADLTVAMIHVRITGLVLGIQALDIVVGRADAHSEFAQTLLCQPTDAPSVSAQAYAAKVAVRPVVELTQGYAQIAPTGGDESEHIADLGLPADGSLVSATVADSRATGSVTTTGATSRAWAQVGGDGAGRLCVLRAATGCAISATAVRSESRSTASPTGSPKAAATDTGTQFVDLKVLGASVGVTVRPNSTIALPGIGFVVLNEQTCDDGSLPVAGVCSGDPRSGLTVRALRVVVTVADAILGASPGVEVVLAEARSAASYR